MWQPREDLRALLELGAPSACAGCGEPGVRWCGRCDEVLHADEPGPWSPTPALPGMPPTWSGAPYADEVRTAVVAWKDGGRADLTPVLALLLRDVLAVALTDAPVHLAGRAHLVPAPSARRGRRARGEHRVGALARAAAPAGTPTLTVTDALRLGRRVADQAGLGAAERAANLAGSMRVRRSGSAVLQGDPCIVVDDVVTTGATLVECARVLREAGSGPVLAVTLAATRRRRGPDLPRGHRAD